MGATSIATREPGVYAEKKARRFANSSGCSGGHSFFVSVDSFERRRFPAGYQACRLIYRETSKNGGFKERENMTRQETESEVRASDNPGPRRMLNEKQVLAIVPVSPVTLWRLEKAGKFPRSTYISPNRRVWFEDEIIKWQNAVNEFNPNRRRGKGRGRRASTSPA
jgi:predicted DNA-binding transcriptional regulator AlpA